MSAADPGFALERARVRDRALWGLAAGTLLAWSGAQSGVDLSALVDAAGISSAGEIARGLLRPDLSAAFLARIAWLTLESVAIAACGLALALGLALPLAALAARLPQLPDAPGDEAKRSLVAIAARAVARGVLSILRAVPEIVWAYLFVRMLGLGPGPGVLAIGVSFAGVIGRLYAELLEAVDPAPVRALRATGSGWFGVLVFGALPQVRSQWVGYGLFRFECALRSAAVLGVVGAGGLGSEIQLAVRYFEFDKLATALLALLFLVVALELASAALRRRPAWLSVGLLLVAVVLAAPWLGPQLSSLFGAESLEQAWRFARSFFVPTTDLAFWLETAGLVLETVAIAAFGTLVAALVAFALAPFAVSALTTGSYLEAGAPARRGRWAGAVVLVAVRFALQLGRALPDLVWALVFVVWVGPGAFAGALAIAAHTTGLLGRLFSEVYEECEVAAPRAVEATGAASVGVWAYAVLPQVRARLAAHTLFRFDVNLRVTAMLGFVGAGGLGDAIHTAISLFHFGDLAVLLLALLGLVLTADAASGVLRRRLLGTNRAWWAARAE